MFRVSDWPNLHQYGVLYQCRRELQWEQQLLLGQLLPGDLL